MKLNFCAIDFETACNSQASACAVALVRVRDGVLTENLYSLIKPPEGMAIRPGFTAIHGITMNDVAFAPTFEAFWPGMLAFIGSDYLVAHNKGFDRAVLKACIEYYHINYQMPHFECTVVSSRRSWPDLENHKLNTVSDFLKIQLNHHEALSDAMACARIYLEAHKCCPVN